MNVSTPQAVSMLKGGLIDIAVLTTPLESSSELIEKPLKEFREVAVGGEAFKAIAEAEPLSASDFCRYPIVSLGNKTSTYEFYLKFFAQHGASFSADIEAATADQLLPLIKHNLGIGFVPEDFLEEQNGDVQGIFRLPLRAELPQRSISLVKKRNHTLSLPARELERMILGN